MQMAQKLWAAGPIAGKNNGYSKSGPGKRGKEEDIFHFSDLLFSLEKKARALCSQCQLVSTLN